jgi:hypothetical protein
MFAVRYPNAVPRFNILNMLKYAQASHNSDPAIISDPPMVESPEKLSHSYAVSIDSPLCFRHDRDLAAAPVPHPLLRLPRRVKHATPSCNLALIHVRIGARARNKLELYISSGGGLRPNRGPRYV